MAKLNFPMFWAVGDLSTEQGSKVSPKNFPKRGKTSAADARGHCDVGRLGPHFNLREALMKKKR